MSSFDLYDKTTYKYTKDKNLISNQYTKIISSRFSHSDCGPSTVKNVCRQWKIGGRKIERHSMPTDMYEHVVLAHVSI